MFMVYLKFTKESLEAKAQQNESATIGFRRSLETHGL